jgi:hypothetical protein
MGKIEEYIKKNREELDMLDPSPEIWKGIENELTDRRPGVFKWLSVAAMIAVVFASAALFYVYEARKNIAYDGNRALVRKADQFLKETEIYYNGLATELMNEAAPLLTAHPDIKSELITDLSQVDSICAEIKLDLRDNIANQEVIEALVNNYRIKIRILEEMLDVLKQNETDLQKNETHAL